MFERIKKWLSKRKRVTGLSKAMDIVDAYMCRDLTPGALDRGYGAAYTQLRIAYIDGEITENELQAALVTLDNQYRKLRPKAVEAMINT